MSGPSRAHPLWDELMATFPKAKALPGILGWEEGTPLCPQKSSQLNGGFTLSLSPPVLPYTSDDSSLKYGFKGDVPKLKAPCPPASPGPAGNLSLISKELRTICWVFFLPQCNDKLIIPGPNSPGFYSLSPKSTLRRQELLCSTGWDTNGNVQKCFLPVL